MIVRTSTVMRSRPGHTASIDCVVHVSALLDVPKPYSDAIRATNVDAAVLGCTQDPFVEAGTRESLGTEITSIDCATGIAEPSAAAALAITAIRRVCDLAAAGSTPSAPPTNTSLGQRARSASIASTVAVLQATTIIVALCSAGQPTICEIRATTSGAYRSP